MNNNCRNSCLCALLIIKDKKIPEIDENLENHDSDIIEI